MEVELRNAIVILQTKDDFQWDKLFQPRGKIDKMNEPNRVFRPMAVVKPLPGQSTPPDTSLGMYDTPRPIHHRPKQGLLDIRYNFPSSPVNSNQPSQASRLIEKPPSKFSLLIQQFEASGTGNIKPQVAPKPKLPPKTVALPKPVPRVVLEAPDDHAIYGNVDFPRSKASNDQFADLQRSSGSKSSNLTVDLSFESSSTEDSSYMTMNASQLDLTMDEDKGTEKMYLSMRSPEELRKSLLNVLKFEDHYASVESLNECNSDKVDSGSSENSRPNSTEKVQTSTSALTSKFLDTLRFKRKNHDGNMICMIPRPKLTVELITHDGYVQYYQSGKVSVLRLILCHKSIRGYEDPKKTRQKVELDLHYLVSIQSIVIHNSVDDDDTYWFKLALAIPKNDHLAQNTDWLLSSQGYGNTNSTRKTYIFGVHSRSDRNEWLMNILKSVTGVFTDSSLTSITKAGWCYTKTSESANWTGAWLLVMTRKLHVYNCQNQFMERIDLRKASSITQDQPDETIRGLYVDSGTILTIKSPPLPTMHFIMATPTDTAHWKKYIEEAAYANDDTLEGQQLTERNVPVMVERCINFIYTYGSLSEGIYSEPGSPDKMDQALEMFKRNAFTVRLIRSEFTEDDVADALKKFFRKIPNRFFGKHISGIINISKMASVDEKIAEYIELLQLLSKVEYNTLKLLLGQLRFLASMEHRNRMDIVELAKIWGKILLVDFRYNLARDNDGPLLKETAVMIDLIQHYETLFEITPKELESERQMIKALEQYHTAEKGLRQTLDSDTSVHMWIVIEPDCKNHQVKVTVTATMTAADVCKEVASKTEYEWHSLTLYEVIDDGRLARPIQYDEIILEITERWSSWETEDRKSNCLKVRPIQALENVYRYIQKAPILTPSTVLSYADRRTKGLKKYKLQLLDQQISVFKIIDIEQDQYEEVAKIDLRKKYAFVGCESKRDHSYLQWALTLVDRNFTRRTKECPFIGSVLGGADLNDHISWHASILHSIYKDAVLPKWNKQ